MIVICVTCLDNEWKVPFVGMVRYVQLGSCVAGDLIRSLSRLKSLV